MTTNEAAERLHPVYPGGPSCNPNCPGEHSMYHDGYADGYENGERAERRATVERIRARIGAEAYAESDSLHLTILPSRVQFILDEEAARPAEKDVEC